MELEYRTTTLAGQAVTMQTGPDGKRRIVGYGAVFYRAGDPGTEYRLAPDVVERISPRAFDRMLRERDDTRGLYNHNRDWLLGRVSAGTLTLTVDDIGLRYEILAPDTQIARDVMTSIERRDLSGSSFAFFARRATWSEDRTRKLDIRTVDDAEVLDIGPVTYPAYKATTTGLRAIDAQKDNVALGALNLWRARARLASL